MRHSVIFARVFSTVILTILVTAVFTTVIYTFISGQVFTSVQEQLLFTKARRLAEMPETERQAMLSHGREPAGGRELDNSFSDLLGAYLMIVDGSGRITSVSESIPESLRARMLEAVPVVRENGEVRTSNIRSLRGTSTVCVGVPDGDGAVLLAVPLYQALVAQSSLRWALIVSLVISLPLVAALIYQLIRRIVAPIRQMRDVALNMAGGNFGEQADDSQQGEIGQLGHSLNYLSQQMNRLISNLVIERNRLEMTIDSLREGIISLNGEGAVTHINPSIRRLFETARPAGTGDDPRMELIPMPEVWQAFDSVLADNGDEQQLLTLPDRTLMMHLAALRDESGRVVGAVGLFADVTESERLERTRRDYVANVSHEMRTPLTAMRALIEPLSDGIVTNEQTRRRYYSILLRETMRLSRLIDDLMELSRLQSGTLSIRPEMVSVENMLPELEEKYGAVAVEKGVSFTVSDAVRRCPTAFVNADRLEQLLVILIDNAMKYTPEGGQVTLDARWNAQKITFSVSDTGIGIDPADQPYVFDRFYKVDKAHSGLGSGLGLSIAKEMIVQMGEEIRLRSEPGKGSEFAFTVPVFHAQTDSLPVPPHAAQ
ncbi:MAG: HAMP domain-containing protein [Clostridia bacterium]|nr:HAMP domain-containing protein [Clostridia bacterium]